MCLKCRHKKNQICNWKPIFFRGLYHACVLVDYHLQSVFLVPIFPATKCEDFYHRSQYGCKNAPRFWKKKKKWGLLETLVISVARPSLCKNSQSLKDIELTKLRSPECPLPSMISYCSVPFIWAKSFKSSVGFNLTVLQTQQKFKDGERIRNKKEGRRRESEKQERCRI